MGVSTTREISIASFSDGLYWAFSNRMMVSRLTPTFEERDIFISFAIGEKMPCNYPPCGVQSW